MNKTILKEIRDHLVSLLEANYGYAGVAEMPGRIIINSGGEGETILVTIEDRSPSVTLNGRVVPDETVVKPGDTLEFR